MPHEKIRQMAGMGGARLKSPLDHNPHQECHLPAMTERETRQFLKEEQAEGMHPSLKGKRF